MKSLREMMSNALVAALAVIRNIQKQQMQRGTAPRYRRGKDRSEGPGTFATIHMLTRSVNKGYRPPTSSLPMHKSLMAHSWYRNLIDKAELLNYSRSN